MNTLTKVEKSPNTATQRIEYATPDVDILETTDAYVLEADMPGVTKSGLEVLLENSELTIVGRREDPVPAGDALYRESNRLPFRRTFTLDPMIDTGQIKAQIVNGVLTVTLPKTEKVKPRKIQVSG